MWSGWLRLRAILPQVAEDYEIIIVNDGSRDRTGEIANRLVKEDQKVRVVHHEKNQGYGAAIRNGINALKKNISFLPMGTTSSMSPSSSNLFHSV